MFDFLKKLASKKAPTAADIRIALAGIDEGKLAEGLLAAESARREAILRGEPEAALDRLDATYASAERAIARARIARAELEVRLAEAEQCEAAAALDRERDEAEREAATCAEVLAREWPDAQRTLLTLLARLEAAEAKVTRINHRLGEAGRDDLVKEVEWRVRVHPEFCLASLASVRSNTVLPMVSEWGLGEGHGAVQAVPAFWSQPVRSAAE